MLSQSGSPISTTYSGDVIRGLKMIDKKYAALTGKLNSYDKVAVAYSGGVDSTFLLKCAYDILKDKAVAILAVSPLIPANEIEVSRDFCKKQGISLLEFNYDVFNEPVVISNPKDRCYHCKKAIFTKMKKVAGENGIDIILDDTFDDRPGIKALSELGIISPLKECELTKQDIRFLSERLDLPTWDKPSYACLATRIPTDTVITKEKLHIIERSENVLHEMGFLESRVRLHDNIARIEISEDKFDKIIEPNVRNRIVGELKEIGFDYICLDLKGR